jgi:histidinol-phosphate aminotransferase
MPQFKRPHLAAVPIYTPGRSLDEVRRSYGLQRVIKLASNENPLGPAPQVVAVLRELAGSVSLYPDAGAYDLRRALAEFYARPLEEVLLGNGSAELIDLICRAFLPAGNEMLTASHSFEKYTISTLLEEGRPVYAQMRDFHYDLPAMEKKITSATRVIFIANPNNPTGTMITAKELDAFLDVVPEDIIVVIDEAYYEYARLFPTYPDSARRQKANVITLRSFSKAHGLAGLRLGYMLAPAHLVEQVAHTREAFNTGLLSQAAGIAALHARDHVAQTLDLNRREQERLRPLLKALGFEVYPSATNFFFVKAPQAAANLAEALLSEGIIVRPLHNYSLTDYLRISVGTASENDILVSKLQKILT